MKLFFRVLISGICCFRIPDRWLLIPFLYLLLFFPQDIHAMEVDEYRYTTIGMRVDLIYTSESSHSSDYDRTDRSESFEQRYTLDAKGLVVNPDLMNYKASLEFTDADTTGSIGENYNRMNQYAFGSTILRRSRIPLTLDASRVVTSTSSTGETTADKYGIDWYLKFRTLPWTRLTYDKTLTQSDDNNEDKEVSTISVLKTVGAAKNSVKYSLTNITDDIRGYSSQEKGLDFKNDTKMPLNTNFYISVANKDLSVNETSSEQQSDAMASGVGLKSAPVDGLTQNLSYTLTDTASDSNGDETDYLYEYFNGRIDYKNEKDLKVSMEMLRADTENSGESSSSSYTSSSTTEGLAGSMAYNPKKNIKMYATASTSSKETSSSESGDTLVTSADYSGGAYYSQTITPELTAVESINYSKEEANSGDQYTGVTGRAVTDAAAALKYRKNLTWSTLDAGSSAGLHQEKVEPDEGGQGTSYGLNAGLSNIKLRHFTLNSMYNYNNIISTVGDVNSKDQTLTTSATGSHTKYLPLTVSHVYHDLESYLEGEGLEENTVEAAGSVLYIQKIPVTMTYKYYTLARPDSIPPELQYIYIKEKIENNFEATVGVLHIKWLPVNLSYKNYFLKQPYETPTSPLSSEQNYYHTEEQHQETLNLSTSLTYFRKTSAYASLAYSKTVDSTLNTSTMLTSETGYIKRSVSLGGSHNTNLLRGRLGLSTGYTASKTANTSDDVAEYNSSLNFNGTYDKRISRNMKLGLVAGQSFSDTNGVLKSQLTGQANLYYKLRAWFLSAGYEHAVKKQENQGEVTVTEDKVMLKVSRSFVRVI